MTLQRFQQILEDLHFSAYNPNWRDKTVEKHLAELRTFDTALEIMASNYYHICLLASYAENPEIITRYYQAMANKAAHLAETHFFYTHKS